MMSLCVGALPGCVRSFERISDVICSDGRVGMDEACDDGNLDDGDGCDGRCRVETAFSCSGEPSQCQPLCGNGQIDSGEDCDDMNSASGDGCSSCRIDGGFACTGAPSACTRSCGNGHLDANETCDDGARMPGDGCSAACLSDPGWVCVGEPSVCAQTCGNGEPNLGEQCDDGNTHSNDGCNPSCAIEVGWKCNPNCSPICGDFVVTGEETCDFGPANTDAACTACCRLDCRMQRCGDGIIDPGEACDDGNLLSGDGCGACQVEPFWTCGGAPSACSCVPGRTGGDCSACRAYVIPTGASTANGQSWDQATDLPSAIDRLSATRLANERCEVWLQTGVYHAYGTSSADYWRVKSGVTLLGGFAGDETSADDRASAPALTILSATSAASLSEIVTRVVELEDESALDNLTVNGARDGASGGAVYAGAGAHVKISRCAFSDIRSGSGGALHLQSASAHIEESVFTDNWAIGVGARGGAIFAEDSALDLDEVRFDGNVANAVAGSAKGGAVSVTCAGYDDNVEVTADGAAFVGNEVGPLGTSNDGGALFAERCRSLMITRAWFESNAALGSDSDGSDGGALYIRAVPSARVDRAFFLGNSADRGGAIVSYGATVPTAGETNLVVLRALLLGNSAIGAHASSGGGAAYILGFPQAAIFVHTTIYGNTGHDGGAFQVAAAGGPSGVLQIMNSIVYANTSQTDAAKADMSAGLSGNVIQAVNSLALCAQCDAVKTTETSAADPAFIAPPSGGSWESVTTDPVARSVLFTDTSPSWAAYLPLTRIYLRPSTAAPAYRQVRATTGDSLAIDGVDTLGITAGATYELFAPSLSGSSPALDNAAIAIDSSYGLTTDLDGTPFRCANTALGCPDRGALERLP